PWSSSKRPRINIRSGWPTSKTRRTSKLSFKLRANLSPQGIPPFMRFRRIEQDRYFRAQSAGVAHGSDGRLPLALSQFVGLGQHDDEAATERLDPLHGHDILRHPHPRLNQQNDRAEGLALLQILL